MSSQYNVNHVTKGNSNGNRSGCFCSTAVGFLLTLLALAIAVGVGLIVHFAGNDAVNCRCQFDISVASRNETSLHQCLGLALNNNADICGACPDSVNITETHPTSISTPSTTTTTTITQPPHNKSSLRLPSSLYPIVYTVFIKPDFYSNTKADFVFYGRSSVLVHCYEDTSEIKMHLKDLNVADDSILVTLENGSTNMFESYVLDHPSQTINIRTSSYLEKGRNYSIVFQNFSAPIRDDALGLYLASYDNNGTEVYYVNTQMESTEARKVFPCFDEPAMKAHFDITLARSSDMTALSNMPLTETYNSTDGWVHDKFERTPLMSTYLLAFVVCDCIMSEVTSANGINVRLWTRKEAMEQSIYSLEFGSKVLTYFEDFFNISFPIAKQDMIALEGFLWGAMENWGLIIYGEDSLLYMPGISSAKSLASIYTTTSHEISHNWFGNLVSPVWWDDLWLKEGFATFMQYRGTDFVEPDSDFMEMLVYDIMAKGMHLDGIKASHPLYIKGVEDPDEILLYYDGISYQKGCAVIRMLEFFVGKDTFKRGVTNYLKLFSYKNAGHQDLWRAIGDQAKQENKTYPNIAEIMDTWVYQMGFPTVTVEFTDPGILRLTQERFLRNPSSEDPEAFESEFGYKWDIPFTFTTSSQRKFNQTDADVIMMKRDDGKVAVQSDFIPSPTGNNWVIANIQYTGYFRVNYDIRNWNAIIHQLNTDHTVIHSTNRLQIILDAWNLARSGDLDFGIPLKTLEYIGKERGYAPLSAQIDEIFAMDKILYQQSVYGKFKKFMRDTFSRSFEDLSFKDDGSNFVESLVRNEIVEVSCYYGNEKCLKQAQALLAEWMTNPYTRPSGLNPEVANTVYCNGVKYGGEEEWNFMYEKYKSENVASEKDILLNGLACVQQPWLIARYMNKMIAENSALSLLKAAVYLSKKGPARALMWDFYRNNYDLFNKKLGSYFNGILLKYVCEGFNTQRRLSELQQLGNEKGIKENTDYKTAVQTNLINIAWIEQIHVLDNWMTVNGYQ